MISTVKATMHKMVGALADDLLPPRDLAKAAFAVMVWASSKMSAEKPHPKVYQLAVDRLRVPAAAIAFQSSNAWDAYAASAFGMRVVWCNRYGQRPERLPGAPDRTVKSLAELPALVGAS